MKRNAMRKNLRQSILRSLGRYLAIVMIIALGSSMFVGLLMTKSDMVATGQAYMDQQNMFDLRLISSYGWEQQDVDAISRMEGVSQVEGVIYLDLMVQMENPAEDGVYRFYAIPESINQIVLRGGRWPENGNECLIDGYHMTDEVLGTKIVLSDENSEDSLDSIQGKEFTVVGYVGSPLYMDLNRGTTSVGNGSLMNCLYLPRDAFDVDYFAEINVTIPGDYRVYSPEYLAAMETAAKSLEPEIKPLALRRMEHYRKEALKAYEEGLAKYEDGLRQFEEGKAEAEQELADGYQQLMDAERQIDANEALLASGQQQIADAKVTIADAEKKLAEGKAELESMKDRLYGPIVDAEDLLAQQYAAAAEELAALDAKILPLTEQIEAITAEIADQESRLNELNSAISDFDAQIAGLDARIVATQTALDIAKLFPNLNAELIVRLEAELNELTAQRAEIATQRDALDAERADYQAALADPLARRSELETQRAELQRTRLIVQFSVDSIVSRQEQLAQARAALDAQFASYEEEIRAGEEELKAGKEELAKQEQNLISGRVALEDAKVQLAEGWTEYEDGKLTVEQELSEAEQELADAKKKLDEAKEIIDGMTDAQVFILNRNSNVGYNSLDSASDIVQGVSRVLPAFFLLVAALVCITTMTRMIDEERTQIGTLKALGYSNGAIISKYLVYAGSGAILGCGLGVLAGSVVFPKILWEAYKILLYVTDDTLLKFDWALCAAVVGTYTAVMLLVTWYCCRKTLKEVSAELIRPKAPDAGKKILLEYLPFWDRISFLNKVTIRNIFRYRQRLAMMLVGIGGCTALLVAGFGLRDSIVSVVDYQFEHVTTYDMTIYFAEGQTEEEQQDFLADIADMAENAMFYHQSSVDLDHNNQVKEIYLIAAESGVRDFIDFHSGGKRLDLPAVNEVFLTVGVSEALGIRVGDEVMIRNADMQMLTLTVSGIYDNHVENYAVIHPDTIENQWGEYPEMQMAFVTVRDDVDKHTLSSEITGMSDVMNVAVSEDFATFVGSMMDALDLVVWVIVVCAGLLAVIVLYNLTNININERIREIATIKVLGFNATETAAYVFKENISLTVIGSICGIGLGYLLLLFVMDQIKIDMVWFKAIVTPGSYVLSVVLTILAAIIVDFVFFFKLDKINMAEALKSVE